jgi:hypothetical protein
LRLLTWLNAVDRRQVLDGHVFFVALTYPAVFPTARESKRQLERFIDRHDDRWGKKWMFWKLEPQKRGAPHYHLLVGMGAGVSMEEYRGWFARAWSEIAAAGQSVVEQEKCRRVHQHERQCQRMESWNGVAAYAGKYLGKTFLVEGWEKPGRYWGIANRAELPVVMIDDALDEVEGRRLKRYLRRWYESQRVGNPMLVMPQKFTWLGGKSCRKVRIDLPQDLKKWDREGVLDSLAAVARGGGGYVGFRRRRCSHGAGGMTCFMSSESFWRLRMLVRSEIEEAAPF